MLQALQACVACYTPNTLNLYSVTLWDSLKYEILNVQEEELAQAALQVLSMLGGRFSDHEGPLNAYLRPIIKECNEHLEDAPTKQSQAAGVILKAVAESASAVADQISKGVLPTISSLYKSTESLAKRRGLLEVFNRIASVYVELAKSSIDLSIDALKDSHTEALESMLRVVHNAPKGEVSLRLTAIEGLTHLLAIPQLLSNNQSIKAVDAVTNVILHEKIHGHGDIRTEAIGALTDIAGSSPALVRDRAIPAFLAELPDSPGNGYDFTPVLEAFVRLSTEQQVFDTVIRRLKNKLQAAKHQNALQNYQRALLLAILYAFMNGSPVRDEDGILRSSYYNEYAEPLVQDLRSSEGSEDRQDKSEIVGRICNTILRPQGVHFQNTVHNQNLSWLSSTDERNNTSGGVGRSLLPFSLYYYAALRAEVVDPAEIVALLQTLSNTILSASSASSAEASICMRHLALLINKYIDPKAMESTLTDAKIEVTSLLSSTSSALSTGIAFTIVKALLIQGRSAALTTKYMQALLQLLSTSEKTVARRFTSLLAEDNILTKENHCLVSGLYKQKTFNQVVPGIIEAVRTADPDKKPNYLIALSGILRWLPYSMIETSLASLIPPLLQTLDLNAPEDQEAKNPALTIFESVLMHDPSLVTEHVASLITRLLSSTTRPTNTAAVRAKSLQCLTLVPRQLSQEKVVPYRRQVVKKLMPCLDDPRRDVRVEAVRCRKAWLGLDEEEEEAEEEGDK